MAILHSTGGRRLALPRALGSMLTTLALLASCRGADGPTVPEMRRDGKGGPSAGTGDVVVSAASPATAKQDTTLDVTISGSGFGTGARAVWSLNGDTTRVHVKSTRVVSATQVIATVIVPLDAPVALYSIEVAVPGGKKGVGAELFLVTEADPTADFTFDNSLALRSDGYSPLYSHGVCGVWTQIFLANGGADAYMQTDNPKHRDRKCAAYPRKLLVDYGDGVTSLSGTVLNLNSLSTSSFNIPVGTSAKRGLNLADSRCNGLRWKAKLQEGVIVAADSVIVTRVNATTFTVRTQAPPNNRAYCIGLNRSFNISVGFTIVTSRAFP